MQEFDSGIRAVDGVLDLRNRGWVTVDDEVWDMGDGIHTLLLATNKVRSLPPQLAGLSALRVLDLSHNALELVPPEIGSLAALEKLSLAHNKLEGLPDDLSACVALVELDVSGNKLKALPAWVAELPQLRKLTAAQNALAALPLSLADASHLDAIDVTGNDALAQVHPLARTSAKLIRWICSRERAQVEAHEAIERRFAELESANTWLEFERSRLEEELARVTAERDSLSREVPVAYLRFKRRVRAALGFGE
jgi:hypothetical protein